MSASQVTNFERCERYWYFGYIQGIKLPASPAMLLGSGIHKSIEHYLLNKGEVLDNEHKKYVLAMVAHLPNPKNAKSFRVELKIDLDLGIGLPRWIGFIDLLQDCEDVLKVRDYKTTSDFRYCKTPVELAENTQLIAYAQAMFEQGCDKDIEVSHTYIRTRTVTPQIKTVSAIVTRDHVVAEWYKRIAIVKEMTIAALSDSAEDLEPTLTACGMYGGCPYRKECGVLVANPFENLGTEKGKAIKDMDFLKKLKSAVDESSQGEVCSQAAPSRLTTAEEANEEVAKKRGRKKLSEDEKLSRKIDREQSKLNSAMEMLRAKKAIRVAEVEAAEAAHVKIAAAPTLAEATVVVEAPAPVVAEVLTAPIPVATEAPAVGEVRAALDKLESKAAAAPVAPVVKNGKRPLTLYIDCMPVKGETGYVLFEDWWAEVANKISKAADLEDYRLLPYAQEKAAVSVSINELRKDKQLPEVLVVSSSATGAKDALSSLIPCATQVIRALRG